MGAGAAVRGAAGWTAAALAMPAPARPRPFSSLAPGLPLRPHGEISRPPEPTLAHHTAGTFLGMADELLLDRARSAAIVRAKLNRGGSSLSFRLDLADGSRVAFKPAQTNLQTIPRKEVAAYRINRLLGLNAVPPACSRRVARDDLLAALHPDSRPSLPRIQAETIFDPQALTSGQVSYWIPQLAESGLDTPQGLADTQRWLSLDGELPPEKEALAAQLSNLAVFDFLIDNPDRYSGGNMKMSPDGERLYFMDNTMAFFLDPAGHETNRSALLRTQRFSRALVEALDRLTFDAIRDALAEDGTAPLDLLTPAEIRAVVTRAEVIRRYVRGLVELHGAERVLAFP